MIDNPGSTGLGIAGPDQTADGAAAGVSGHDWVVAGRLDYLEAMRGIAALVVVSAHIFGAVALEGYPVHLFFAAMDTPLSILLSGHGAVMFFFVLSGYVLVLRPVATGDQRMIVKGALKRWPRLAGPVLFSTILSSLLWRFGLYRHQDMAAITGNVWLQHFTYSILDLNAPPSMGFRAAIETGTVLTFVAGDQRFNSALWTMMYEFYGSFALFLVGAVLIVVRPVLPRLVIVAVAFGVLSWISVYYAVFGAGLSLAVAHLVQRPRVPLWVAGPAIALALYAFGYREGSASYAWLHLGSALSDRITLIWAGAGVLAIAAVSGCAPVRRALGGRFGRLLGGLSFPVYLVHLPVLLSAGCATYVALVGPYGTNIAFLGLAGATLVGTMVVATVLMLLDRRWVRWLNRATNRTVDTLLPPRIRAAAD